MRVKLGLVRQGLLAVAMTGGLLLSGCGSSAVESGDLEQEVSDRLAEQVGETPKNVDCPDDLEAEAGAEVRCTLTTPDDTEFGVTVTVTGVEGDTVNFDIQVDEEPSS